MSTSNHLDTFGEPVKHERDQTGCWRIFYDVRLPCPCGQSCPSLAPRTVSVRDAPYGADQRVLEIRYWRYRCSTTGGAARPLLPGIDLRQRMTARLLTFLAREGMRLPTCQLVRLTGVSESTLHRFLTDLTTELERLYRPRMPRHLGLDGTHPDKQGAHLVAYDLEAGKVIDMRPGETAATTRVLLDSLPDKTRVEAIVTDLGTAIVAGVQAFLAALARQNPDARPPRHIIDRFHVCQLARKVVASMAAQLPRDRLTRAERATLTLHSAKRTRAQQAALQEKLDKHPELKLAHDLLQLFLQIYDSKDRAQAEAVYDAWVSWVASVGFNGFDSMIATIAKHRRAVFNFFDVPLTNGRLEGTNQAIKSIDRQGRHYSFRRLRARVLRVLGTWSDELVAVALDRITGKGWTAPLEEALPPASAPHPEADPTPANSSPSVASRRRGRPPKPRPPAGPTLFDLLA